MYKKSCIRPLSVKHGPNLTTIKHAFKHSGEVCLIFTPRGRNIEEEVLIGAVSDLMPAGDWDEEGIWYFAFYVGTRKMRVRYDPVHRRGHAVEILF